MEKQQLQQYLETKALIKLNLKNGRFFTGIILKINDESILFKDKFNQEIPVSLDSISYVIRIGEQNGI